MSNSLGRARKRWEAAVVGLGEALVLFSETNNAPAMRRVERLTGDVCRTALALQKRASKGAEGMAALAVLSDQWARAEYERASKQFGRPLTKAEPYW